MASEPLSVLRQKGHAGNGVAFLIEKETLDRACPPAEEGYALPSVPFPEGRFFVGHIIY